MDKKQIITLRKVLRYMKKYVPLLVISIFSPLLLCCSIMSPTMEPGSAMRRYWSHSQLKNQLILLSDGTNDRVSGAYESRALMDAMNAITSHLSF